MCEGIGDFFYVRPRRTIPCIVPEGRTQPWAVCGPPATYLHQYPPPHSQLREGGGGQALPVACARPHHWVTNGPRTRCRLRQRFQRPPWEVSGPSVWQPLPQTSPLSAPPPPVGRKHLQGMSERCASHPVMCNVLQALAYGVLLLQRVPLEGITHSPFVSGGERIMAAITMAWSLAVEAYRITLWGGGATPAPPSFFYAASDADLDYSVKGKCFFRANNNLEMIRVGDLCSSTLNYSLYCSPDLKNPSLGHRPMLVTHTHTHTHTHSILRPYPFHLNT